MGSEINDKYTAAAVVNIDVVGLASSATAAGNQSDMIDNSLTGYSRVRVSVQIKLGISPAANTAVYIYALRGDKHASPVRTDGAAATKGALTFLNAPELGVLRTKASPATGDVLSGEFEMVSPGPEWGIGISQDTGAVPNATPSNHLIHWVGIDPQVN
jgi:hypothetical protein